MDWKKRTKLFWVSLGFACVVAIISTAEIILYLTKHVERVAGSDGLDLALSSVLLFYVGIYVLSSFCRWESPTLAFSLACFIKAIIDILVMALAFRKMRLIRKILIPGSVVIRLVACVLSACVAAEIHQSSIFTDKTSIEIADVDYPVF